MNKLLSINGARIVLCLLMVGVMASMVTQHRQAPDIRGNRPDRTVRYDMAGGADPVRVLPVRLHPRPLRAAGVRRHEGRPAATPRRSVEPAAAVRRGTGQPTLRGGAGLAGAGLRSHGDAEGDRAVPPRAWKRRGGCIPHAAPAVRPEGQAAGRPYRQRPGAGRRQARSSSTPSWSRCIRNSTCRWPVCWSAAWD